MKPLLYSWQNFVYSFFRNLIVYCLRISDKMVRESEWWMFKGWMGVTRVRKTMEDKLRAYGKWKKNKILLNFLMVYRFC